MRRRRWQPLRMLRVLLACLVLWMAAGPSVEADVWSETAALIAHGAQTLRQGAPARPGLRSSQEQPSAKPNAVALTVVTLRASVPASPAVNPSRPVLVLEDVYLRNCALLC